MNKQILITLLLSIFLMDNIYSQGCINNTSNCENGNGISTNPNNPLNPNCGNMRNNFDWRVFRTDNLPEDYIIYGPSNVYKEIQNPFTGPSSAPHAGYLTNQFNSNYQPEDGWELLKVEFGIKGNVNIKNDPDFKPNKPSDYTKPKLPYLILYNKYTGTMRFFGSLLDAKEDYETLEIILSVPTKNAKYFPENGSPIDYNTSLKATNLLSIQGESIQPLDQETKESSISIFIKFRNNENEFFWFDLPVAYDPCLCNNRAQLDVFFQFTQTAEIALNQVVNNGIKTEMKQTTSGNKEYAKMVFGRVLAAGVSGTTAIATGGAVVNIKAFIDLVDIVKNHPSRNQKEKENLTTLRNYLSCSENLISVVKGNFKDADGNEEKKKLDAGIKIFEASASFLSSMVSGCNNVDNAATATTKALEFTGSFKRRPAIGGTEIFLAMPGSNWAGVDLLPKDYVSNNTQVPSYPTYNERLGVFALIETPKYDFDFMHETQVADNNMPVIMPTGRTVCSFKLTDDLKYVFNPLLNVNYNETKIYCRIVIKKIDGLEFSNSGNFKFETVNNNLSSDNGNNGDFCSPIRHTFNFNNKFFESIPNSSFSVYSTFVDINQFKNMPLVFSYYTNDVNNLDNLGTKVKEGIFIQFKILLTSNNIGTHGPNSAYHIFTYPIDLHVNQITEPHQININSNCVNYTSYVNSTFLPLLVSKFSSNIPSLIDENKEFDSDQHFLNNEELLYSGVVTISAKMSTAAGKKVKIYSTLGFDIQPGAEISPDIELIVGLPLQKVPQPPQTYSQISAFCSSNKYKAQIFSQDAVKREKETYEAQEKLIKEYEESQKSILSFKVFPNPTTSNFNVSVFNHKGQYYTITLMDVTGKIILNQLYSGQQSSQFVETNFLAAGIYFVKVTCGESQKTEKLIIANN